MSKTTQQDFEFFKDRVRYWQKELGLTSWAIYLEQKDVEDGYARTYWQIDGLVATVQFCTVWDDLRAKNDEELNRLALHELLHLSLAPLLSQAQARYTVQDTVEMIEHTIVRQLEHVLLEKK